MKRNNLFYLIKDSIVGGPSIVLNRYHEADKTSPGSAARHDISESPDSAARPDIRVLRITCPATSAHPIPAGHNWPLPRPGRSHTCPPSRHRPTERLGLGHVQNSSAASGSVPQADHFGPTDPQAWLGPVADAPAHAASEVRSALPAPGRPGDRLIVVQETRSQRSGAVGARLESVGGSGPTPSRRPAR